MLDIKLIRESPDVVRKDLKRRGDTAKIKLVDGLVNDDAELRKLIAESNSLRQKRNIVTDEIAKLKREKKDAAKKIAEMKEIPERIRELDEKIKSFDQKVASALMAIPNILHESVPVGKDDSENVEVRRAGTPPKFGFAPKNHFEIVENLRLVDSERAGKVAGAGFFYLKDGLALLDQAIARFAVDFLMKKGYTLVSPPYMMRREPYLGVTDLEFFGDQLYKIDGEDLYLIATSEHPMAAMYMNETLDRKDLPIKLVGVSPCFRKETGAHGKYTKGFFRMHQFNKVEQFIFCLPDESWALHEELQRNSEELYKKLGLPFRVVNVCTGDIGSIAAKKYDTEVWMADGTYREAGSNSNCTDYQARRLGVKYREGEGKPPSGFVHTLNNTALATSRAMVAIIENYQRKDGSVGIPKALVPYMGGMKYLKGIRHA